MLLVGMRKRHTIVSHAIQGDVVLTASTVVAAGLVFWNVAEAESLGEEK